MSAEVEVRCPNDARRLFAKLRQEGKAPVIAPGNLMEFSCRECKQAMIRSGRPTERVLHRYDLTGQLVETVTVPAT